MSWERTNTESPTFSDNHHKRSIQFRIVSVSLGIFISNFTSGNLLPVHKLDRSLLAVLQRLLRGKLTLSSTAVVEIRRVYSTHSNTMLFHRVDLPKLRIALFCFSFLAHYTHGKFTSCHKNCDCTDFRLCNKDNCFGMWFVLSSM